MDIIEKFPDIYERSIIDLKKHLIILKNNNNCNLEFGYSWLQSENELIGILEYIYKKNVFNSKICFYRSTLALEWLYKSYDNKNYNIDDSFVSTYSGYNLFYAILSGSVNRRIYMANLFGNRNKAEKDDFLPTILVTYGLKYIILDDIKNCYKYITKFEEIKDKKGMKLYYKGYGKIYKGLVENDELLFNEGLKSILVNHKRNMIKQGRFLEQYFCYEALALVILAKEKDINVNIKHDLLPLAYLEHTDIDYNKINLFE